MPPFSRVGPSPAVLAALLVILSMATAPANAGEPNLVKVPLDIDVYDHPGGEGKPRGQFLKAGSQVDLLEQNADHWCHVAGANDPVPGGSGWIWCGKGDDGQDYSVKPVAADTGGMTEPTEEGATESPADETPEPTEPGGGGGGSGGGGGGE
jgi:hypothetical protein